MKLQKRIIIDVGIAFLILITISELAMFAIISKSNLNLEKEYMRGYAQQSKDEILIELAEMEASLKSWAWWNETYEFMQGNYESYLTYNLYANTLLDLETNFIWLNDENGKKVHSMLVDLETKEEITVPAELIDTINSHPELLSIGNQNIVSSGIIHTSQGLMMIAKAAIMSSEKNGSAAGSMILGRYLNKEKIFREDSVNRLDLKIYDLKQIPIIAYEAESSEVITAENRVISKPISEDRVGGYAVMDDYFGEPTILLAITSARNIYHQGRNSLKLFAVTLFIIAFIIVLGVVWLFHKLVISRIARLNNQAAKIAADGDFSQRLVLGKNDEISELKTTINQVLHKLNVVNEQVIEVNNSLDIKVKIRTKDLETINLELTKEIEERIKVENNLCRSLEEKQILLHEVHHRVKNNIQIISSLLKLQSYHLKSEEALKAVKGCQNRVKAMALVHDKLIMSPDVSHVGLHNYVNSLLVHIFSSWEGYSSRIKFSTNVELQTISIDTAIPLGIIITELVTNSLQHAFNGEESGEIIVTLHQKMGINILNVKDDGKGISNLKEIDEPSSLGWQLVEALVKQLHGKSSIEFSKGTNFRVEFKAS